MEFNRWSKKCTIQRISEEIQNQNIIDVQSEILCLDRLTSKFIRMQLGAEGQMPSEMLLKKWIFYACCTMHGTLISMKKQPRVFFYITFSFSRGMACAAS